jgi:hypothetical protein
VGAFDSKPAAGSASDELNLDDFVTSNFKNNFELLRVLIYAASKTGKSFAAATVSEHWPESFPLTKKVKLEDYLSVTFDRNGTIGFAELGVEVNEIDVRKLIATGKLKDGKDAMRRVPELVHKMVETRGIKAVCVDTLTMADKDLERYWMHKDNIPRTGKSREPDRRAAYGEMLQAHGEFWREIDSINAKLIFNCHAKVNNESVKGEDQRTDAEQAKLTAMALGGTDSDVQPAITGQSYGIYVANVDMILPMRVEVAMGGKLTRKFLPYGGGGMAGGVRLQYSLKSEEEANLNKLLKKIRGNISKYLDVVA